MNSSVKMIVNLMNIAEEMLFSINLKPEIVDKYQNMRESVYDKLGIPNDFAKYRELQKSAQEAAETKKNMQEKEKKALKSNLEESNSYLTQSLIAFNQILHTFKSLNLLEKETDPNSISISLDISNYSSELAKFTIEVSNLSKNIETMQKYIKSDKENVTQTKLENEKLTSQLNSLKKIYEDSFENLENEYKSRLSYATQTNLKDSKKISALEMSFQEKETQLIGQLDKLSNEDASVLKHLREKLEKLQIKNEDLRGVLKAVCERTSIIFNEFVEKDDICGHLSQRRQEIINSNENKIWHYYSDILAEIDFIGYSLHKLRGDNDWLVEQLDCFCKENDELKNLLEKGPKAARVNNVFNSLSSNDLVVKDFDKARRKLLSQFKDMNPIYD
jgi:chromosome segregation ATPase